MSELSILVATVPSRRRTLLARLLAVLEPQIVPGVEVLVHRSETKKMGTKFDELYQAASGRLSVQVDDDDLVADDYVDQILAVSSGHDFVGYQVQVTVDGEPWSKTIYEIDPRRASVLLPYHPSDLVRHVTPKCPVETVRARQHHFGSYFGADYYWTTALVADGYPFRPVFIPKVLYHYDCWPKLSLGTHPDEWTDQREVPLVSYDPSVFTWIE